MGFRHVSLITLAPVVAVLIGSRAAGAKLGTTSGVLGQDQPRSWLRDLARREATTYSQNGEDGVLTAIFEHVKVPSKYYVEFGVEDGRQRNTRLLQERFQWSGLLLDGGFEKPEINLHKAFISEANIVDLFTQHSVPRTFGLLSVDIDSYDFWVLKQILQGGYRPAVIVTEVNSQVASGLYTVAPAAVTKQSRLWGGTFEFGAAPEMFTALVSLHGYATVYCESRGVNCFHVQRDLLGKDDIRALPDQPRQQPRYGGRHAELVCWPSRALHTPWYKLSPNNLSIVSYDARPARIPGCSYQSDYGHEAL